MMTSERALVLAPNGRDGALAASLLTEVGRTAHACQSFDDLLAQLDQGAGLAILAIEALQYADLNPLTKWIERQPAWSDFPFIILTHRVGSADQHPMLQRLQAMVGNVIFLDRPFHPSSLINVVDNSLRGRRRQYQARKYLEELREGEERLETALVAGRMGSWSLDVKSNQLIVSPQFMTTFGQAETAPFSFDDLLAGIHEEDRGRVQRAFAESMTSGTDFAEEYRIVLPDGAQRWVESRARLVRGPDGQPLQLIGVASDITARRTSDVERDRLMGELALERERTQAALVGERALSGLIVTSVPAGIVGYDNDLRVTIWNPVMERLFGVGREAAVGRPLAELIASGDASKIVPRLEDALRGVRGPIEQIELTTETGRITLDSQHAPLTGGDGSIAGGAAFFRDITESRQVEEQLRHAQKMETIGQLTGGIAHDFNNLLAAVQGNLELLRKRLPDDPQLRRYLDGALQGASRGASLTSRLLAFARKQELKPEATDLKQLLDGMRGLIERSIGPLINVRFEIDEGLPSARVDANQLELAILNLAVNARDAMPGGGDLTLSLKTQNGRSEGLQGNYLVIAVRDTGIGMDAKTLESAVEPFFSTKELGKGTGLGLSMVHGLAIQLDGKLKLKSRLGEGTVAQLWLPVSQYAATHIAEKKPDLSAVRPSRILVVDDDVLIAMNTVDLIEDLGHAAVEANSGQSALEILASGAPLDAMITDFAMPGMNGVELATRARALRPGLPILLASGYAELPSGTELNLPRLSKPFFQADLAAQLSKILVAV
jgi:PAS domain S-box-containing protein